MTRKKPVYVQHRGQFFSQNTFGLWLVESKDGEPLDMEGQLHKKKLFFIACFQILSLFRKHQTHSVL
jgi:hypothetical protein